MTRFGKLRSSVLRQFDLLGSARKAQLTLHPRQRRKPCLSLRRVQGQIRVIDIYRDRLQSQSKGGDAVVIGVHTPNGSAYFYTSRLFFFLLNLRLSVTYCITEDQQPLFSPLREGGLR